MRLKITLFSLLCLAISANAQDARAILDKAAAAYNNAGGITASFTLESKNPKAKYVSSYDGTAQMKGNKFKLEIPEGITWFDGKTQWVYIKETDEVNVSNPTGEELQAVSPSALFSIYKTGHRLAYKGEKVIKGKSVAVVELIPQKKGEVSKISVCISKATNIFASITIYDKSGMETVLTINKMQTGVNLSDASFAFNKKDYPKAEIIDLR